MPYKLRKAPKRNLYWVVSTETGKKHSAEPISRAKAEAQKRVLESAMLRGGVDGDDEDDEYEDDDSRISTRESNHTYMEDSPEEEVNSDDSDMEIGAPQFPESQLRGMYRTILGIGARFPDITREQLAYILDPNNNVLWGSTLPEYMSRRGLFDAVMDDADNIVMGATDTPYQISLESSEGIQDYLDNGVIDRVRGRRGRGGLRGGYNQTPHQLYNELVHRITEAYDEYDSYVDKLIEKVNQMDDETHEIDDKKTKELQADPKTTKADWDRLIADTEADLDRTQNHYLQTLQFWDNWLGEQTDGIAREAKYNIFNNAQKQIIIRDVSNYEKEGNKHRMTEWGFPPENIHHEGGAKPALPRGYINLLFKRELTGKPDIEKIVEDFKNYTEMPPAPKRLESPPLLPRRGRFVPVSAAEAAEVLDARAVNGSGLVGGGEEEQEIVINEIAEMFNFNDEANKLLKKKFGNTDIFDDDTGEIIQDRFDYLLDNMTYKGSQIPLDDMVDNANDEEQAKEIIKEVRFLIGMDPRYKFLQVFLDRIIPPNEPQAPTGMGRKRRKNK